MNEKLLGFVGGLVTAVFGVLLERWFRKRDRDRRGRHLLQGARPSGGLLLTSLPLSANARQELEESEFIGKGETAVALSRLLDQAGDGTARKTAKESRFGLRAICGFKGNFAVSYYRRNFAELRTVQRIFSFESILDEINDRTKRGSSALDGLKLHLDKGETQDCEVEVVLIKKGHRIAEIDGAHMAPPSSFGLAILMTDGGAPKHAVVHWEMAVDSLRDLVSIEGVIVDSGQEELLKLLVTIHSTISNSDVVVSSSTSAGRTVIQDAITELEGLARTAGKLGP